jgi:tRNA threonylcarbamoyladenosine biosynthesis protein TsaB
MRILAVEFSSTHRGVAVLEDSRLLGQAAENGGRRALGLVEEALRQAGCEREDIETIAIGLGPGSYTGIRGAIALAQGWQLGRAVQLIGVSSSECLAAQLQGQSHLGPANIVIDAQRDEFYLARYQISPGHIALLDPLRLASRSEIEQRAARGEKTVGPDLSECFPGVATLYPDAAKLGILAMKRNDFVPGEKLEPIYLRETNFKKAPPLRVLP